jgi:hypothetical protein
MQPATPAELQAWTSFYVIVGSSAGALTGLQFVVMALVAQILPGRDQDAVSAFGSPNVVHFCAALAVAALLTVPWRGLEQAGLTVSACGLLGVLYAAVVVRRALRQSGYQPVFEDWLWHAILPTLAYAALLLSGMMLTRAVSEALLVVAGAVLLLVFIGIHNAWDTVTYVTVGERPS